MPSNAAHCAAEGATQTQTAARLAMTRPTALLMSRICQGPLAPRQALDEDQLRPQADRRAERQKRAGLDHPAAGAGQDRRADERDARRAPAHRADPLAQERHGENHPEYRIEKADGGRVRQRNEGRGRKHQRDPAPAETGPADMGGEIGPGPARAHHDREHSDRHERKEKSPVADLKRVHWLSERPGAERLGQKRRARQKRRRQQREQGRKDRVMGAWREHRGQNCRVASGAASGKHPSPINKISWEAIQKRQDVVVCQSRHCDP